MPDMQIAVQEPSGGRSGGGGGGPHAEETGPGLLAEIAGTLTGERELEAG